MYRSLIVSAAALFASAPAFAQVEYSVNFGVTTDYVFRGASQSNEDLSINGGFDLTAGTFYAGTWLASIDFGDGSDANVEWDTYAGLTDTFANGVTWDVGGIYYAYPDVNSSANFDFFEVYGALSYDFASGLGLSGSLYVSPDYFGGSGTSTYTDLSASFAVNEVFSLSGGFGYQTIDDAAAFGTSDYAVWNLGGTFSLNGFDFDARYYDTDEDNFGNLTDERIVFSVSRAG
ncbi:hypothetical protein GC169_07895 [bacterium]|nr:hypothetical protein [bacterium]